MPFAVEIYPTRRLAVVTFTGDVEGDTILAALGGSNSGEGPEGVVWDGCGVTSVAITHEQVERIIEQTRQGATSNGGRSAWVTDPDRKDVGMVGMLLAAQAGDGRERRAFTGFDEAAGWAAGETGTPHVQRGRGAVEGRGA